LRYPSWFREVAWENGCRGVGRRQSRHRRRQSRHRLRQSRHRLRLLPTEPADSPTGSPTSLWESVWRLLGVYALGCLSLVPWHTGARTRPFPRRLSMCSMPGPWGGSPNWPNTLGGMPKAPSWVGASSSSVRTHSLSRRALAPSELLSRALGTRPPPPPIMGERLTLNPKPK
jgi:hypothetical protein